MISGELRHVPGTIDSVRWEETREQFASPGLDVLSPNAAEGKTTLTLNY